MSGARIGDGFWQVLRQRFSSPLGIYGLMVYTVLVGVIADHAEDLAEVFIATALTQVVFFAAHTFAHTLGEHGDLGLREALGQALRHSSAMLYAPIPPAVVIGIGALLQAHPDPLVNVALLVSTLVLGVLGYAAYAQRTRNVALRLLGATGTGLLGVLIMIIEYAVH